MEKYGVLFVFQDNEVKGRIKETNLERYGVENPAQSEEIKNKTTQTNLERYGVENPAQFEEIKDKIKTTNLKKYGVECSLQSDEVRDKTIKTNLERYGVEHPTKTNEIKDKIKTTNIERYGVECSLQSDEVKEKIRQTNLERYGVEHFNQKHISNLILSILKNKSELEQKYKDCGKNQTILSKNIGISQSSVSLILNKHQILIHNPSISQQEIEVLDFVKSITDHEIITNDRTTIYPLELDIFIPSLSIAIEFNGCYWHSGAFKDRNYHYNKWKLCKEQGISLIQICESDWVHKKDIIKSIITSRFGVYINTIFARKCEIRCVSYNDSQSFLQQNHLQGNCVSKIRYGLYYENKLVSLMTFGKSRFKKDTTELIRFCNLLNTRVVGGSRRLFKYFTRNNQYKQLVSYSDCDYFSGDMYQKLGFKEKRHTGHSLWFVDLSTLEKHNRFKYMKHKNTDMKNIIEYCGSGNLEWKIKNV